jgi:hypothetical protein
MRIENEEFRNHNFFKKMDWKQLFNSELKPPYIPKISSPGDTSNFSNEITSIPLKESLSDIPDILHFSGFSFVANS